MLRLATSVMWGWDIQDMTWTNISTVAFLTLPLPFVLVLGLLFLVLPVY